MPEETLANLIPWTQLGLSAIFLIMIYFMWKKLEQKDKQISDNQDKIVDVIKQNTIAMLTNADATKANTEANKALSQQVYDALIKRK